jgi:DNA-binding NarL/FixJ family response regulator
MSSASPIQVVIIDDHQMIIEGIRTLLSATETIQIVGYTTSHEECLDLLKKNKVDVVLMDINMPGMNGIELCSIVKSKFPGTKVLALSTFDQGSYVNKMIDSGAQGYVLKNADADELEKAIHRVHSGEVYLSAEIATKFYAQKNAMSKEEFPILTPREKEVLLLITKGLTNPEIAKKLFVSLTTIESHRKNLYSKLKVRNTAMLIAYALDNNLLDPV